MDYKWRLNSAADQLIHKLFETTVFIDVDYLAFGDQMHPNNLYSRKKVLIAVACSQQSLSLRLVFTSKQQSSPELVLLIVRRFWSQN